MLRLQTLVGLEIEKILNEIADKKELIDYLTGILEDPKKLDAVVVDEMIYMKDTYGDARKTTLSDDASIYDLNANVKALKRLDEMVKDPVITWIGGDYKIKVLYQSRILNIPADTFTLTKTHNQDKMIAISDKGELVIERLKDLGKFTVQSDALDVVKHYGLKNKLLFSETMGYDFDYLIMITNHNTMKKIDKELLLSFRKFPTIVMGLEE
jgi:DNA gyrase/topoisomerase IV subunit A